MQFEVHSGGRRDDQTTLYLIGVQRRPEQLAPVLQGRARPLGWNRGAWLRRPGEQSGPTVGLGSHSEVHGKAVDPARHIVGLETDDIQADYARLKGFGVEFLETPKQGGPVTFATLKDPEGNYLQLVQFNN